MTAHRWIESLAAGATLHAPAGTSTVLSGWLGVVSRRGGQIGHLCDFLLPGDSFILTGAGGDCEVTALTRAQVRHDGPGAASAILGALRTEELRLQAHVLRLGSLNARARLAHLAVELHDRLAAVGLVADQSYRLPLTQQRIAEYLGVTVVHLNRTLRELRTEGMVSLKAGRVTLPDLVRLRAVAAGGKLRIV